MSRIRLLNQISQHECLLRDKEASYDTEKAAIEASIQELKACAKTGEPAKLQSKLDYLNLRVESVSKWGDEVISAQKKHIDLLNQDLRQQFERMHGLLAFAIASGGVGKDAELLFGSLDDFLGAKTDGDRKSAEKSISLCLEHGSFGSEPESASTRILDEYERITDDEARGAFYKKNRKEIMAAHDARKFGDQP